MEKMTTEIKINLKRIKQVYKISATIDGQKRTKLIAIAPDSLDLLGCDIRKYVEKTNICLN